MSGAAFALSLSLVADSAAAASAAVAMISAAVAAPAAGGSAGSAATSDGGFWLFQALFKLALLNK